MNSATKCMVCSEATHKTESCQRLYDPIKDGFQKPPPGGGGGGGGDDDESMKNTSLVHKIQP